MTGMALQLGQQCISALKIERLPGRQMKACGLAQSIHAGVNLGAQAAPAAPDGLCVLLFFAPALCWCARTIVESIVAHTASPAGQQRFNQTPLLLCKGVRAYLRIMAM